MQALLSTQLSDIVRKQSVLYWVTTETKLQDVLKVLNAKQILSAPVYDEKSYQFQGFVDVLQIARVATKNFAYSLDRSVYYDMTNECTFFTEF